ncbi:MAG: hypothetical protein ACXWO3_19415 [Isosphaeraceae bacterium]
MSVPERLTRAETPGTEPHAALPRETMRHEEGDRRARPRPDRDEPRPQPHRRGAQALPHNLPFGVTGSSSLVIAVGKQLSLKTIQYPNESAVSQAFDQGRLYGALIAGNGTNTLLPVGAASSYAGYPLTTHFEDAAAQQKATLKIQARNNPPSGDPFGVIPSLIPIPLLIGGYVASTALMSANGTPTGRWRVAILAGFAVVGGLLMDLISGAFALGMANPPILAALADYGPCHFCGRRGRFGPPEATRGRRDAAHDHPADRVRQSFVRWVGRGSDWQKHTAKPAQSPSASCA